MKPKLISLTAKIFDERGMPETLIVNELQVEQLTKSNPILGAAIDHAIQKVRKLRTAEAEKIAV